MSLPESSPSRRRSFAAGYATTRRSLLAATAVFGAMAVNHGRAHAMALFPFWGNKGGGNGGKGGGHGGTPGGQPGGNQGGHPGGGSGPSCFLRGTRILTPHGEVKIEDLAVGDLVTTADGSAKPIAWVGHWTYSRTPAGKWREDVLPVKVARSALAPSVPHTDLYISQEHSLYLDGLLIPARRLINGRSIVLCKSVEAETIDYFHIRLAEHDIIFSEGAHTETMIPVAGHEEASAAPADIIAHEALCAAAPSKLGRGLPSNRMAILRSRVRSAVSPWIDIRRPGDAVWERLAERAETRMSL
jgi:hypothetical protein